MKTLIVYYSQVGSTKWAAEGIAAHLVLGADTRPLGPGPSILTTALSWSHMRLT